MSEIIFWLFMTVIGGPGILIVTLAFWAWVFRTLDEMDKKKYQRENPPHCDIDPMCHPYFRWHEGKGYIGNREVKVHG